VLGAAVAIYVVF